MDYTLFYVEANVVSIIIFMLIFLKETGTVGHQTKQGYFTNIILAHIAYFLSDIVWVMILGGYLPSIRALVASVNISNAIVLSVITGFWFVYTELSQGEEYITKQKNRLIALIPVLLMAVVIVVLFVFFPDTVLEGECTMTLTYYLVFLSVPLVYVVVSTVRSLRRAFRKENYAFRTPYLASAAYPAALAVIGITQTLWLRVPMFCFGCAVMMLYVYITSLNNQVSIDELTKLNNRTQLKKYIAGDIPKQNTGRHDRYVLMIDLNKFKQINDQHGHIEGDNALKRAADALRLSCSGSSLRPFITRYGGDEFIIIAKTESEELVRELSSTIKETLIRLNKEAGSAYELTASIGYASYAGDIAGFQTALAQADEALYREKAALKSV